jgi:hypothetical protein
VMNRSQACGQGSTIVRDMQSVILLHSDPIAGL